MVSGRSVDKGELNMMRKMMTTGVLLAALVAFATPLHAEPQKLSEKPGEESVVADVPLFPGKRSDFGGYDRYDNVKTATGHFSVICPKKAAPGKPWL